MSQPLIPDAPPVGAPPVFEPPKPLIATLSCGLPVWMLPRPGLPLVSLRIAVTGGSLMDPPERPGLGAFADALLTRGAGAHDALAFAELTERLALGFSISTSTRATTIGFDTQLGRLETGLDLLAELLLRPRMEEAEIERLRALRLGDLLHDLDDPDAIARGAVQRALFGPGHPAAHLPRGRRRGVAAARPEELRASWAGRAGPGRALLTACGAFEPEALLAALEQRFGGWRAELPPPRRLEPPPPGPRRLVLIDHPGAAQSVIALLAPAPAARSPELHGARVATIALGGMFTSRLNRRLREEKGYTYGVSAQLAPGPELSLLAIRTSVQREPTADALRDLLAETDRIREGLDEAERGRAAAARVTQLVQALESRSSTADSFASLWEAGRPPEGFHDEVPALGALRQEEVLAGARALQTDRAAVVVVGDLASLRASVEAAVPGDWQVWPREPEN